MSKRQPIGERVATSNAPAKDELTRLIKTIARQAAREAFCQFIETLESRAGHAAAPSDSSTRLEQAPEATAGKDPSFESVERFLSVAEVAKRLDVSEKWVRRKIAAGDLPARRVGKLLRVGERALAAYLAPARRGANNR